MVVVSKLILVISLKPKSRLINSDSSHIKSENVRFEQALIRSHSRSESHRRIELHIFKHVGHFLLIQARWGFWVDVVLSKGGRGIIQGWTWYNPRVDVV